MSICCNCEGGRLLAAARSKVEKKEVLIYRPDIMCLECRLTKEEGARRLCEWLEQRQVATPSYDGFDEFAAYSG